MKELLKLFEQNLKRIIQTFQFKFIKESQLNLSIWWKISRNMTKFNKSSHFKNERSLKQKSLINNNKPSLHIDISQ